MTHANQAQQAFRLSDLEAKLMELLPDGETIAKAYICCENVGKPIPSPDDLGG